MSQVTSTPTALIAEDEPLLAQALQAELARAWPALRVVASVGDGVSAVQQTLALRPDVLFFDICMPGQSGLEAAADLLDAWPGTGGVADAKNQVQDFPLLVFVTAYDQYAVQAFEAQALDYLLKPVQPQRLQKTVTKLQSALASRNPSAPTMDALVQPLRQLLGLGAQPGALQGAPLQFITASVGAAVHLVPVADILYLQAADKYVLLRTAQREYLVRTPLKDLVAQLDARTFWQIHRSTVVQASAVASVQRDESGRLRLHLRGSSGQLPVSRLFAHRFAPM